MSQDVSDDQPDRFYRSPYAPVRRRPAPWYTIREAWIALAALAIGVLVSGGAIWLIVAAGFVLTER